MRVSPSRLMLVLGCLIALLPSAVHAAEPYRIGDTLEAFTVNDAKGGAFVYEPGSLALLLVSYEMGTGKAVNAFLEAKSPDFLSRHRAAFLANIHGMPGVGRFFALPKMAKYPHRILLADSETLLTRHPVAEDRITVFTFDAQGRITAIRQVDPKKDLASLFASP